MSNDRLSRRIVDLVSQEVNEGIIEKIRNKPFFIETDEIKNGAYVPHRVAYVTSTDGRKIMKTYISMRRITVTIESYDDPIINYSQHECTFRIVVKELGNSLVLS